MEMLYGILLGFCGGVFGALIGGVTSFVFCGFLGIIGIAIVLAGGSDIFLYSVAFGPLFGPHVAFSGGVAAVAFLAKKERVAKRKSQNYLGEAITNKKGLKNIQKRSSVNHNIEGTNIMLPLLKTNDFTVLIVGGVFGVIGFVVYYLLNDIFFLRADNAAITVALCGIL
ncbi:MAG: hypothetical protein GX180_13960, partial [Enterococcus sp.]|nr:hypothetical protein [Enterococcus sp.]